MKIKLVKQKGNYSCFVAAVAMIQNISFDDAFKKVRPKKDYPRKGSLPVRDCFQRLSKLGINYERTNIKHISKLKKNSLILLRWVWNPDLAHFIIYDAEQKSILDPAPDMLSIYEYEESLFAVYYLT